MEAWQIGATDGILILLFLVFYMTFFYLSHGGILFCVAAFIIGYLVKRDKYYRKLNFITATILGLYGVLLEVFYIFPHYIVEPFDPNRAYNSSDITPENIVFVIIIWAVTAVLSSAMITVGTSVKEDKKK